MREIKYRAWCKLDKKMYSWEEIKSEFTFEYFEDSGLDFLQYTGLKDAKGKEIYNGDIFKGKSGYKTVEYKDGAYITRYKFNIRGYDEESIMPLILSLRESFVIGNIQENPELMEG